MKITGNTILITGGSTGIGLALAEAFLRQGNRIIICGRREQKLQEAQRRLPEAVVRQCDVASSVDRLALFQWATTDFGDLNMLVNNAGIQKMIDFKQGAPELDSEEDEIEINLSAPIHLSALFIPHLLQQPEAAILNITSGLGFIPIARMPVYSATKAALHSFSWSLRQQLRDTTIKVFEIIPPTVDTELDRGARARRGQVDRGIPPEVVAEGTLQALAQDQFETAIGFAEGLRQSARQDPEAAFLRLNGH